MYNSEVCRPFGTRSWFSRKKCQLPSPSGAGVVSGQNFIRVTKLCRNVITPTDFVLFLCPQFLERTHQSRPALPSWRLLCWWYGMTCCQGIICSPSREWEWTPPQTSGHPPMTWSLGGVDSSQGSIATQLRFRGIFSDGIIANFLLILTVK